MILPHGHPPDLRWSLWDARLLRSASTSWSYDAVSRPQPADRPAFPSEHMEKACWGHRKNSKLVNKTADTKKQKEQCLCVSFININGEATSLTGQTPVVYTEEQVEKIVEIILRKLSPQAPAAVHLDNSISQQTLPGTKMTLSVSETAEMIGISKPKVYDLLREGKLPSIHVGKKIVIPKQAVIDWLSGGVSNGEETC